MPDPLAFFNTQTAKESRLPYEHSIRLTRENFSNFDRIRKRWGCRLTPKEIETNLANKEYADLYMDIFNKASAATGMVSGGSLTEMLRPTWRVLDPVLWTRHVE